MRNLAKFLKGAVVGAVLVAGVAVLAGMAVRGVGLQTPLAVAVAAVALLAAVWHLGGRQHFPLDRRSIQASRELVRFDGGKEYFGVLLGAAVFTEMSTPLVYGLVFFDALFGVAAGFAAAVGFALGRSTPAVFGSLTREPRMDQIVSTIAIRNRQRFRLLGAATAVAMAALAIWSVTG